MSVTLYVHCDGRGCDVFHVFRTGNLHSDVPPGWTRGRGYGNGRPRRDWCRRCSKIRAAARRLRR